MLSEFREVVISESPLMPPAPVFSGENGGVVDFYGVVRAEESGECIGALRYEAYMDMARHQLEKLAGEASEKFAIHGLWLHHRLGAVPVGEPSLFVRVAAKHRGPAFAAAQWIIGRLKEVVPIWKHPVLDERTAEKPSEAPARSE